MSITTSQQITKYYELYQSLDVTFTKEVVYAVGLNAQQCYLKCVGEQWPCVIYSTSFQGAKIIASVKPALRDKIARANNSLSVRFSFKLQDKVDPVTFFVSAKLSGYAPYSSQTANPDLVIMTVKYTQRPPDPLIEIMGKLLEANMNSAKRRDDRILLTQDVMRKIMLLSKETILIIQNVPRKCIIRDISFSGAKVIIVGLAKFLIGKECTIRLDMDEPKESYNIKGKVVRFEEVEGRKDLAAIAVFFDETTIPMTYKMRINDYLTYYKKQTNSENAVNEESAKQKEKASTEEAKKAPNTEKN